MSRTVKLNQNGKGEHKMLQMVISKNNGWIKIRVDGVGEMRYLWYSKREAERRFREKFNLKGKKLEKIYL